MGLIIPETKAEPRFSTPTSRALNLEERHSLTSTLVGKRLHCGIGFSYLLYKVLVKECLTTLMCIQQCLQGSKPLWLS